MVDIVRSLRLMAIGCLLMGAIAAQCANQWLPGAGLQDTDGEVNATVLWDEREASRDDDRKRQYPYDDHARGDPDGREVLRQERRKT